MAVELPIEGLSVGHYSDREGLTGCTVGAGARRASTASVDIRGGAPGTLETALLSPYASVSELHAVLLTGGSAPGLGAAAGVTAFLQEKGYGYQTAVRHASPWWPPRSSTTWDWAAPTPARSAGRRLPGGRRGGADGGGGLGGGRHRSHGGQDPRSQGMMKGGVGLASVRRSGGGVTVSALTVVNALGDVLDEQGEILAGARRGRRLRRQQGARCWR